MPLPMKFYPLLCRRDARTSRLFLRESKHGPLSRGSSCFAIPPVVRSPALNIDSPRRPNRRRVLVCSRRCSDFALIRTGSSGQKNSPSNAALSRWLHDRNRFGGARRLRRSAIGARPGRTRCRADRTPLLGDGWRRSGGLAGRGGSRGLCRAGSEDSERGAPREIPDHRRRRRRADSHSWPSCLFMALR